MPLPHTPTNGAHSGDMIQVANGTGDKPKAKSTTSNASDLSNSIKADLPFFAKMLDLSGEQQVKLGLYLEFANTGSLGRLRDM